MDDEESYLYATAEHLREAGLECDCAVTVEAAQEMLQKHLYDLLIADIKMPGNENLEFVTDVSRSFTGMPILLLTARASLDTAIRGYQLPVVAYIDKTSDIEDLIWTVQATTKRSKMQQIMRQMGEQLQQWSEQLRTYEESVSTIRKVPSPVTIESYTALMMQNVMMSVASLKSLTEAVARMGKETTICPLFDCPRVESLVTAIKTTVEVLQKTKKSFKSKELAGLRSKLMRILAEEKTASKR
jgi:DNA-binding response OmpR family regulator